MLKVHVLPSAWGLPSVSPFCLKLLTWLRMAEIPHEPVWPERPGGGPKGKFPFVVFDSGERLGDSSLIIDRLTREHGVTLDEGLSRVESVRSRTVQALIEDRLYFAQLWERWVDDAGYEKVRADYFEGQPWIVRTIAPPSARRIIRKQVWEEGTGRHSPEEIADRSRRDVEAIGELLGADDFMHGRPTSIDAVVYGFLGNALFGGVPGAIQQAVRDDPRLTAHCLRMRERYWEGWTPPE